MTIDKTKNDELDIALWGCAVRTHLWLNFYKTLAETNFASFKIFCCGHVKPDFDLPENLIYIYSKMLPAPCAEIARRHAMDSNAEYIMYFQDDMLTSPGLLDAVICEIKSSKNELVTGPAFKPTLSHQHCRAKLDEKGYQGSTHISPDRGLGIVFPTMRRSTALKLGEGIDKRFKGISFIEELLLRLHGRDIKFSVCYEAEIAEDMDENTNTALSKYLDKKRVGSRGIRASRRWDSHDTLLLESMWKWSHHPHPVLDPSLEFYRKIPPQFYSDEELIFSMEE